MAYKYKKRMSATRRAYIAGYRKGRSMARRKPRSRRYSRRW